MFEGLAIFNLLKTHQARKIVYVDGTAASIASVIAMSGDEIVMPDNSTMFIHNPMGMAYGYSKDLRKTADELDKIKIALTTAYRRTGLDDEHIAQLMEDETLLLASEAKELGFADTVIEAIPMAASYDKTTLQCRLALMTNKKGKTTMDIETVKNLRAMAKEFKAPDAWVIEAMEDGTGEEGLRLRILNEVKKRGSSAPLDISVAQPREGKPFNSLG